MFVHQVLEDARRRLAILHPGALVADAARALAKQDTPLAVVCDEQGMAIGVISRTDIIASLVRAGGDALNAPAEGIMTQPIFSCETSETLQSVWDAMSTRGLRSAPVLDTSRRPQGILHARDVVRSLLEEVESEEILLRDYVLGIGYQ